MASWFGASSIPALRYNKFVFPAVAPTPFNPLDISDCALWLDANDSSTIDVNKDTSGVNVNRVMKWFDKAKPSQDNHYEKDNDPASSGLYNVHFMTQKPTVYFEPNAYMLHSQAGVVFPFQARTFFAVIKPLTDLSDASNAFISIYNGYDPGAMNTGFTKDPSGVYLYQMCENSFTCGITFDLSHNPVRERMLLMFAQTDQLDLSGNAGAFDTLYKPLLVSDPADSYDTTSTIQYFLSDSKGGTALDIAEIIMYGRLLSSKEQEQILNYLADKWNASGPTPVDIATSDSVPAPSPAPAPAPLLFPYTYIIYGIFDGGFPNWFWCDEFAQVESPAVLADGYDGTTALRDGITLVVSGVFYA